jgi:hypothetical protein
MQNSISQGFLQSRIDSTHQQENAVVQKLPDSHIGLEVDRYSFQRAR